MHPVSGGAVNGSIVSTTILRHLHWIMSDTTKVIIEGSYKTIYQVAAVALQVNDATLIMGLAALPFRGRHPSVMISASRPPLYTMHKYLFHLKFCVIISVITQLFCSILGYYSERRSHGMIITYLYSRQINMSYYKNLCCFVLVTDFIQSTSPRLFSRLYLWYFFIRKNIWNKLTKWSATSLLWGAISGFLSPWIHKRACNRWLLWHQCI